VKHFDLCIIEREKIVTRYNWNLVTGEKTLKSTETVVERCGTPLFGERESRTGICKSCLSNWSVEGNKITPVGLLQLADMKPIRRGDRA
jgi:hypothetical protein